MTERIECISLLLSYIKFKVYQYEMKHYNLFFLRGGGKKNGRYHLVNISGYYTYNMEVNYTGVK